MKKLLLSIVLFYLNLVVYCQSPKGNSGECEYIQTWRQDMLSIKCNENGWELLFEDNFNGNTLNPLWQTHYDWGHSQPTEKQYYHPNNVTLNNGFLELTAKRQTVFGNLNSYDLPNTVLTDGITNYRRFDYTSGMIFSKQQMFGAGKFEIRCKLPYGEGYWPAFWLFGKQTPWNEIDIFEFWNEYTKDIRGGAFAPISPQFGTYYDHNPTLVNGEQKPDGCGNRWKNSGIDFAENFHTFSIEWDEYSIKWFVDGNLKFTKFRFWYFPFNGAAIPITCEMIRSGLPPSGRYRENKSFPRNKDDMIVIVNLAIEGSANNSTPFPSKMLVDYIKIYRKDPCSGPILNVQSNSDLNMNSDNNYTNSATDIIVHSNVNLNSTDKTEFIATRKIIFYPGVNISNSDFSALIDLNACSKYISNRFSINDSTDYYINLIEQQNTTKTGNIVELYPNPANSDFNISFADLEPHKFQVKIYDIEGHALYKADYIDLNIVKISMLDMTSGMYYVEIIDEENSQRYLKKIVKH